MSSSPPPENEFPGETIVENWEAYLLERYRSRDSEKSPQYRSRMLLLNVNAICRFKETRHVEHEYLIAEIYDPDLHQKRYLRIERTVEGSQDTTERTSSSQSISTLSSQSSLGVLKKLPARDRVSTTTGWPSPGKNGDICIEKLDCQLSKMTLLDIAIVAKVVHEHSDKYDVFKRQCFWYSDVITGILQQSFPEVKVTTPPSSSLKKEHAPEAEMEVYDTKSGTFRSLQIYNRRKSAIEEIRTIYQEYDSGIKSSIEEAAKAVEREQKEKEILLKENVRLQKETKEERKEKEEEREKNVRLQKENADLKRRVQEFEGKVTSASGSGS